MTRDEPVWDPVNANNPFGPSGDGPSVIEALSSISEARLSNSIAWVYYGEAGYDTATRMIESEFAYAFVQALEAACYTLKYSGFKINAPSGAGFDFSEFDGIDIRHPPRVIRTRFRSLNPEYTHDSNGWWSLVFKGMLPGWVQKRETYTDYALPNSEDWKYYDEESDSLILGTDDVWLTHPLYVEGFGRQYHLIADFCAHDLPALLAIAAVIAFLAKVAPSLVSTISQKLLNVRAKRIVSERHQELMSNINSVSSLVHVLNTDLKEETTAIKEKLRELLSLVGLRFKL
jgi:hypothetical protein